MGQEWKAEELEAFNLHFEEVHLIPFRKRINKGAEYLVPKGVILHPPLFEDKEVQFQIGVKDAFSVLNTHLLIGIKELFRSGAYRQKLHISKWLQAFILGRKIARHPFFEQLFSQIDFNTVLYFHWGLGCAQVVPFLPKRQAKIVIRVHGFDLYEERNQGYIPFRLSQLEKVDLFLPVSELGVEYMQDRYPRFTNKMEVSRLGRRYKGLCSASADGIFRIVSCSRVVPLKRLSIIARTIQLLPKQFIWTHLGDGPEFNNLKKLVSELKIEDRVHLKGWIPSSKILDFYIDKHFDLFINVSNTEGVPVAIMEALSCGIPTFATDIGGTAEIVDNEVGTLLPLHLSPGILAQQIKKWANLSNVEKEELRKRAIARYKEKCDSSILSHQLATRLLQLIKS